MAVDSLKVLLVTNKFARMLSDFSSIDPTIEFSQIVRAVAIRVIAGALRRTRAADAQRIRESHEAAEFTTMDGKLYKLSNYFRNDALWGRIVEKRRASLQRKLDKRGLAKKSWLHVAEKLGGSIDAPAYVRKANASGNDFPENASFSESGQGMRYALTIINSSPIVQAAGGQAALVYAMQGETRYFYTLLARGAFRNAASRAAKYPGVFVRPLPSVA